MTIVSRTTRIVSVMAILFTSTSSTIGAAQSTPRVPARPTPGPAKPFVFPKISLQTLPNGLRLAVLENHELPIVAVRVGFLGGTFLDAPGKEGGWALMLASLREGTTMRSAAAIADAAADLGTNVEWPSAGLAPTSSFTTIKSAWQPILELVADMVMHPSFQSDVLGRLQAAQANAAARPAQTALPLRVVVAKLYGPDHLYSRIFATDSSIRRVTRDDVVALHTTYVRPQNTVIVVAGDITTAEARAAVDKAFSSWRHTDTVIESKYLAPVTAPVPTTIYLRDFPGATQSNIMSGQIIPSRGSSDGAAIEAVDAILGGASAGSRMFDAFRVSRGLSYNPASFIQWRPEPQAANWITVATVAAEKTDSAVIEWIRVLRDAHGERPLTATELEFSRKNLVRNLPAQLETVDALATSTLGILKNGLPESFYNDYVRNMNSLTLAQVQAAATKYIDPDHLVIAVVGDRAKLEGPLRATGIPVVIVDP